MPLIIVFSVALSYFVNDSSWSNFQNAPPPEEKCLSTSLCLAQCDEIFQELLRFKKAVS